MVNPLQNIRNLDFNGLRQMVNRDALIPAFILEEKAPEEWNQAARIQNTKMFVEEFGKQPATYEEVRIWVDSLINNEMPQCGNTETFPMTY